MYMKHHINRKGKNCKKILFKDEDAETPGTITPTGISTSSTTIPTSSINTTNSDDKNEKDPMIEYILQELQKNKEKQVQDAQMDFAYRQQQADQIVKDIEDYIQKNTKK